MGLTVADVCQLPEKKKIQGCVYNQDWVDGVNYGREEISSLKLSPEKVVGIVMQDTDFCMKVWKAIYSSAHEILEGPSELANKGIEIADKACKKLGGDTSFIGFPTNPRYWA